MEYSMINDSVPSVRGWPVRDLASNQHMLTAMPTSVAVPNANAAQMNPCVHHSVNHWFKQGSECTYNILRLIERCHSAIHQHPGTDSDRHCEVSEPKC
jgi:hypothetical protein